MRSSDELKQKGEVRWLRGKIASRPTVVAAEHSLTVNAKRPPTFLWEAVILEFGMVRLGGRCFEFLLLALPAQSPQTC